MATFEINAGYTPSQTVEAENYALANGYFTFYAENGDQVLTIRETMVKNITKQ